MSKTNPKTIADLKINWFFDEIQDFSFIEFQEKFNKINPKTKATAKLDKGPAKAILAGPHLRSLNRKGLKGTGLAQAKKTRLLIIISKIGKITEPNQSKCFKGFNVSLPAYFAVGSPKE